MSDDDTTGLAMASTGDGVVKPKEKRTSMGDKDFKEFQERMSLFLEEDDDDVDEEGTDQETLELLEQLKVIKRRKQELKKKRRKSELREEINRKMAELAELEESEVESSKKVGTKDGKGGKSGKEKERTKEKGKSTKVTKEKGKDKGKSEKSVKGDNFLTIKDLRTDTHIKKIVDKHMKKLLGTRSKSDSDDESSESSDSYSSTESSSSSSELSDSESSSESDSDSKSKKHRHRHKHVKKHKKKVRSGIKDKPHDKVKVKMNWPQSELKYEFTNRKAVEFKQLSMSQFCAGELEIIRNCKISRTEREGRLALLNKICYYASEFEWSVLLNFYAAWVKLIEKGENSWSDDTGLLEVRMLIGKNVIKKGSSNSSKFSQKNVDKKVWYCPLFQRNKCNISKEGHNLDVAGKTRYVQHICATCLREDNAKLRHPESSSACPHMA